MSRRKLPLESPDWMPLEDAHRLNEERRTGNRTVAVTDLMTWLMKGDVRSMRRGIRPSATTTRELLPTTFWFKHKIESWSGKLLVGLRPSIGGMVRPLRGFVFYVWGPDLKKFLRTDAAPPQSQPPAAEAPAERGRKRVHERADLQSAALGLALRRKGGAPEKNRTTVVNELRDWCKQNKRKVPADSTLYDIVAAAFRIKPTLKILN
jgi:hypothetical protein